MFFWFFLQTRDYTTGYRNLHGRSESATTKSLKNIKQKNNYTRNQKKLIEITWAPNEDVELKNSHGISKARERKEASNLLDEFVIMDVGKGDREP